MGGIFTPSGPSLSSFPSLSQTLWSCLFLFILLPSLEGTVPWQQKKEGEEGGKGGEKGGLSFQKAIKIPFWVDGQERKVTHLCLNISLLFDPCSYASLSLLSPLGKRALLVQGNPQTFLKGFRLIFSDDYAPFLPLEPSLCEENATFSSFLVPDEPLSIFYEDDPNGKWFLEVQGGPFCNGFLSSWSIAFDGLLSLFLPIPFLHLLKYWHPKRD